MSALARLAETHAIRRLHEHDATLFSDEAAVQAAVRNRLGWTSLAAGARGMLTELASHAARARDEGVTDVVLLGMGGSSLASLVISRVLRPKGVRLWVLDTVSPTSVRRVLDATDPATSLYVLASKSGGTIEPNTTYAILRAAADAALGESAGADRFIAVTDPGTALEQLARESGFRACLPAPSDVGGRFSALTVFGLLPAALTGVDVGVLAERAAVAEMAVARPLAENPAAALAAWMCDAHAAGADKLTLVTSPQLRTFGLWVEQLVAESLGKQGIGIVPVVELADEPVGLGRDRAVAVVRFIGDEGLERWTAEAKTRHPLFDIALTDPYDLAAEFVRWEYAVALSGVVLGVNPFDEPNVAEAKAATASVLDGSARAPEPQRDDGGVEITFAGALSAESDESVDLTAALRRTMESLREGDYLALLAYLPDDDDLLAPLARAVPDLAACTGRATCLELGPRYLHSTGQLHKGGPNTGVFVVITTRDADDLAVPGQPWTLRTLHRAQAEGDLLTLAAHDRRVVRVDLPDASLASVDALAEALSAAARP